MEELIAVVIAEAIETLVGFAVVRLVQALLGLQPTAKS